MRPESYRAAARRLRHIADDLERRAEPTTMREKQALTRVIHSLADMVRVLRQRHDRP